MGDYFRRINTFIAISKKLLTLKKAGIHWIEAIQICEKDETISHRKKQLTQLLHNISHGAIFHQEILKLLPKNTGFTLSIDSTPPQLDLILEETILFLENRLNFLKQTLKKGSYPLFLILSSSCLGLFTITVTLPSMGELFNSQIQSPPAHINLLLNIGNAIKSHFRIFPLILATVIFLLKKPISATLEKWQQLFFGGSKIDELFNIALYLKSGVSLLTALDQCQNMSLKQSLLTTTLSEAIHKEFKLSQFERELLKTNEKTGQFSSAMMTLAATLQKQKWSSLQKKVNLLYPLGLCIVVFIILILLQVTLIPLDIGINSTY